MQQYIFGNGAVDNQKCSNNKYLGMQQLFNGIAAIKSR